jgi:hypothetical protein
MFSSFFVGRGFEGECRMKKAPLPSPERERGG